MNKQTFWDSQAAKGSLSGTQDRYAKDLEMRVISKYVKDGMRVLDLGCGDGETLKHISFLHKVSFGIGIDRSAGMIIRARENCPANNQFLVGDLRHLKEQEDLGLFDLIYTQRALINLDSWEEQRTAILDILKLLRPGGLYVMVECFEYGLKEINDLRGKVGLPIIEKPWHNLYLEENRTEDFIIDECGWYPDIVWFSGAYYFMSRVVNAWWAEQEKVNPNYFHPFNKLGTLLPPECVNLRGQTQAWIVMNFNGKNIKQRRRLHEDSDFGRRQRRS